MNTRPMIALVMTLLPACQTTFTGDSKVAGGPPSCAARCNADQLEMGAFVYAGEYSTACVCVPRGRVGVRGAEGGLAAAAAAVMVQMQRAQAAAAQAQR